MHPRKWRRRRPDIAPAPDRLNRDYRAARPNTRWVADITEFPTGEGKLHLAGVRDLCHRGLVGWAMGAHPDAELVVDTLVMALGRAEPDPDGLVHLWVPEAHRQAARRYSWMSPSTTACR